MFNNALAPLILCLFAAQCCHSVTWNVVDGIRFLQFANAAYCNKSVPTWSCPVCYNVSRDFTILAAVYDVAEDVFGYVGYSNSENLVVAAYRGSSGSLSNLVTDLKAAKLDTTFPFYPAGAQLHSGFKQAYDGTTRIAMNKALTYLISSMPTSRVIITGHSLGGALATLLALEVTHTLGSPQRIHLYTYGQPRVGNDVFANFLSSSVNTFFRVTNKEDLVPHVPPMWLGFQHSPQEMWIQPSGVVKMCDGSGEDPNCSDGICTVLCSYSDHVSYFNMVIGRKSC